MKNILKNSLILILLIIIIMIKDYIYTYMDKKEYDFNFYKENELNYYKKEYQELLNIKKDTNYLISKIIYRNIYDFYNEIRITKGKNYNIKKGNLVVYENYLVGVINNVNNTSSTVLLLHNSKLKLSVKINDTYGILESKDDKLYVRNIVSESNIEVGDIIYTSGLTDKMENIPIGKVKSIKVTNDKLEKILEVKEFVNLKDLKYVMIINEKSE